jgi:hypothetical protein
MTDQIEALAKYIRALWVAEYHDFELRTKGIATDWGTHHMSKWDGGETSDGKTCTAVWPRIARFCIEHNLEPDLLIRAVYYRKVDFPPHPNQAHGAKALEVYRAYTAPATRMEIKTELIHKFESQKQRALSDVFSKKHYYKLDELSAWQSAISTSAPVLTPLFRYCVAKNQGWDDLANEYQARAAKQYRRFAEIYDEVWGEWIPAELKSMARVKNGECYAR